MRLQGSSARSWNETIAAVLGCGTIVWYGPGCSYLANFGTPSAVASALPTSTQLMRVVANWVAAVWARIRAHGLVRLNEKVT